MGYRRLNFKTLPSTPTTPLSIICPTAQVTSPARISALAGFPKRVKEVVWMPFRAMSAQCLLSNKANSPQKILTYCYWFKMLWIYAYTITAKMVKLESLGNWANKCLIRPSICKYRIYSSPNSKTTITMKSACCPFPTGGIIPERATLVNFRPKTGFWRTWLRPSLSSHAPNYTIHGWRLHAI